MLGGLILLVVLFLIAVFVAWVAATRGACLGSTASRLASDLLAPQWDALSEHALMGGADAGREAALQGLGPALEANPAASVLDVTAGTGQLLLWLGSLPQLAGEFVGLDPAPKMVARAQGRADEAGLASRVRFEVLGRLPAPYGDGAFDIVVCSGGVELRTNRGGWLREISRLAAPGGLVAVSYAVGQRGSMFLWRAVRTERLWQELALLGLQVVGDTSWRANERLVVARKT